MFEYTETKIDDFSNIFLRVETTNRCNFECTFCTHKKMKRSTGDMRSELFRKIMQEASQLKIVNLDIRNFGEPLLDMDLENKIDVASQYGFNNIVFTTNGFLLTKERYLSLCKTQLRHISISLSPKREYELTRKISFKNIMDNLKQIRTVTMKVPITIHIIASSISSDKEFLHLGYELTRLGFNWVRDPIHNWAEGDEINHNTPCERLWDSFTISWDGSIPLCCLDYNGIEIMGDINICQLSDIINSDRYRMMRMRHLVRDYPPICKSCNYLK